MSALPPVTLPIRVATWNLWWRFGPWEQRQAAIEAVLRAVDADVVCLQEVWAAQDGPCQAALLGAALGMHHARTTTPFRDGLAFGNAVLSRWPIVSAQTVVLPGADGRPSHRRAVIAEVGSPRGRLPVISTHIDHRFDGSATRVAQVAGLCRLVHEVRGDPATAFPTVIGADLNAVPDSDELRSLTGRSAPPVGGLVMTDAWEVAGDGTPGWTWRADNPYLAAAQWPNRRLDYVLVSWPRSNGQGTPVSARLFGTEPVAGVMPSDHAGVVVELR